MTDRHCRPVARPDDHPDDVEAARDYRGPCDGEASCPCACRECGEAVAADVECQREQQRVGDREDRRWGR